MIVTSAVTLSQWIFFLYQMAQTKYQANDQHFEM